MKRTSADRLAQLRGHLEADPENVVLLTETVDLCLRSGCWDDARPLIERAVALRPFDPVVRYQHSVLLHAERHFEESLHITEELLASGIEHYAVRHQHALTLVQLNRFEEAKPQVELLMQEQEELAGLPHLYVRTLHHLGLIDEAIVFARDKLASTRDDATLAGMLSLLYLDDDETDKARSTAEHTLALAPDNVDALVAAATVTLATSDPVSAMKLFERAISLNPRSGRAWLGVAMGSMLEGKLDRATAELQTAVECMPKHLGTWNTLAWVQILQNDFDAAERTLAHCLSIDRTFGETHGSLAVIAAVRGDWHRAERLSTRAIKLQPDSFAGRYAKTLLAARSGQALQAQSAVQSVLDDFSVKGVGNITQLIRRLTADKRRGRTH